MKVEAAQVNMEMVESHSSSNDDAVQQIDINFENIFYNVSVPKQKGKRLHALSVLALELVN